jgi:hypothetical protein
MKLYRFSPIKNKNELTKAARYVSTQTTKLCKKTIGKSLPISSLTIFSHYESEYKQLCKILYSLGDPYNENNGPRVVLYGPIKVGDNLITHLRIRKPDPYRMQVGCNDFDFDDYNNFKSRYLKSGKQNLRLIERSDYEMIEFWNPDFDVLAYVLSK